VVEVLVFFLPSPSLPLATFFVVLLDCIDSIRGGDCVLRRYFYFIFV
jgi:hypothetical protein